ncbi:MAG: hypothetical protein DME34_10920 [Verrucomicrobia bacterium]|nr:MAG: hypothetical protein DME34_10920 [Verrucomicrobiota bacterium]
MITSLIESEVHSQLFTNFRDCGLKGGNRVDGKEKSSKEKISEEKEALRPNADHDSEFLRSHNP